MSDIRSLHGTTVAEIFSSGLDNLEEIDACVTALACDGSAILSIRTTQSGNGDEKYL